MYQAFRRLSAFWKLCYDGMEAAQGAQYIISKVVLYLELEVYLDQPVKKDGPHLVIDVSLHTTSSFQERGT